MKMDLDSLTCFVCATLDGRVVQEQMQMYIKVIVVIKYIVIGDLLESC